MHASFIEGLADEKAVLLVEALQRRVAGAEKGVRPHPVRLVYFRLREKKTLLRRVGSARARKGGGEAAKTMRQAQKMKYSYVVRLFTIIYYSLLGSRPSFNLILDRVNFGARTNPLEDEDVWETHYSEEHGSVYFWNKLTRTTSWKKE